MSESPLGPGDVLEQYRIVELLGAGGMGEVYLADDERLRRKVALKVLPAPFAHDPDRVRRFEQEARAVSSLNHPNIVTLFDLGRAGSRCFMATELVEGRTLRAEINARGKLPAAEAIEIVLQCAAALGAAHAAGIVHRDIKPDNIMRRTDGWVKVLDFGLATFEEPVAPPDAVTVASPKLTAIGTVLGTVNYLSPEQARGLPVDPRTDVFSLGVVLYEMLSGAAPFQGRTGNDIIAAILLAEPQPIAKHTAGLPRDLERVLAKALAKDRDERYQSVDDFARDLRALAARLTRRPLFDRRQALIAAAALVLGTLAWTAWRFTSTDQSSPPSSAPVRTLAVLPFKLLGGAPEDQHLGLGLADAMIVKLTNLRQIAVRPTNAVLKYETGDPDAGEAGRALQVDAVLIGTVQRSGDRIRVTAQLIRTPKPGSSAESLWSDVFPEVTGDLFDLQDRLSAHLVNRLALRLSDDEQRRLGRRDTNDPQAYQLYMEGRFFAAKRTTDSNRRALELFEQAAGRDPGFAPAHLGVALAIGNLIESHVSPMEDLAKLRAALERALTLDELLAEAHAFKSLVARVYDWRYDEAERESQRGIDLEPNNPMVLQFRGVHLLALGRAQEAVALHQRAVEIDPIDFTVRSQLARAYYFTKQYGEAIATGRSLLALDDNQSAAHQWIGLSYAALGKHEEGIAELRRAVALAPENTERTASLAHAFALAGRRIEARAIVSDLEKSGADDYSIATILAGMDDREGAFQSLERARQARNSLMANRVVIDPKLDPLRQDPRFRRLLADMGLP